MEKIREQLEKLLEEERQAKKDEEIVRTLQARILNEEWARRETLEKLQEEQKKMLEAERKKREEFEKMQNDKERELKGKGKIKRTTRLLCNNFVILFASKYNLSFTISYFQRRNPELKKWKKNERNWTSN